MKIPVSVGVPFKVIELDAQLAFTPLGNPKGTPIPVAPVVAWVTVGIAVFTHTDGLVEGTPAVLMAVTVMVPVAFTLPQPPVRGML